MQNLIFYVSKFKTWAEVDNGAERLENQTNVIESRCDSSNNLGWIITENFAADINVGFADVNGALFLVRSSTTNKIEGDTPVYVCPRSPRQSPRAR